MTHFRPGTALREAALALGIGCAASGVVMMFVLFWLPLISYALHYWIDR